MTARRISDSCGYAVPLLEHRGNRDVLERRAERKGQGAMAECRAERNATSLDGLPALDPP